MSAAIAIGAYLLIYAIFFLTGFGFSCLVCRGNNESYRYGLAPMIGALILSISPIYFSVAGVNTSIAAWITFPI
jgi:hypothetical protein